MAIKEFLINGKTVAIEILEQHPAYFKFKISTSDAPDNKIFEISLEKYDPSQQILNLVINNHPVKIKYSQQQAPDFSLNQACLFYIITHCANVLVDRVEVKRTHKSISQASITNPSRVNPAELPAGNNLLLKSPLTGRIIKILVKPGDQVSKNQPLVIIESMKMENEIRATFNGFIKSISISEGNLVQQNQVLIIFE
jgi:biotin carboxyl carrier protein